ncbi:MAG: ABC transporter permease [candidate division Zixibacteria bacterium]|nr:ABC transporter permease [candidate division Zixibacteria bacterium]
MNRIIIVYKKELLDVVRDRRTIISMIVLPILLFPLLTMGFGSIVGQQIEKTKSEIHKIAVEGYENYPELANIFTGDSGLQIVETDDLRKSIGSKEIQAAIRIPEFAGINIDTGESAILEIYFDAAEIKSEFTLDRIKDLLRIFEDSIVAYRLSELGTDVKLLNPIKIDTENVASEEKMSGYVLAIFLPYVIILLTMIGATYPAIDLTAGEKERGTLETILTSPASRLDIALGKFLTVFTTSIITAFLSVTSLTVTASLGFASSPGLAQEISFSIQPESILVLILLMIPSAALFASVLMTVALFAKSYKEAQSYITPLMFMVILPAMVSLIPGIELNILLALVPVVNISLIAKEALMGNFNWIYLLIVILSTSVLASFSIFIAKRQFEREEVLFRT